MRRQIFMQPQKNNKQNKREIYKAKPLVSAEKNKKRLFAAFLSSAYQRRWLYLMVVPLIAYYLIFHYLPMYGVIIAFKDLRIRGGIWGSPWARAFPTRVAKSC